MHVAVKYDMNEAFSDLPHTTILGLINPLRAEPQSGSRRVVADEHFPANCTSAPPCSRYFVTVDATLHAEKRNKLSYIAYYRPTFKRIMRSIKAIVRYKI